MKFKRVLSQKKWVPEQLRMRWRQQLLAEVYRRQIASTSGSQAKYRLEGDWNHEDAEYEDYFERRETARWRWRANKLQVLMPHNNRSDDDRENPWWFQTRFTGTWVLTLEGIVESRKRIREERKQIWEDRSHLPRWVGLLGGTGVGTVLGWLARNAGFLA